MEKKFKAFDRVLIKDSDGIWQIDFYSYKDSNDLHHVMTYGESNSFVDEDILPYEGNEHLVGTTDNPDEEVRLEEGEWVAFVRGASPHDGWTVGKFYKLSEPLSHSTSFYIMPISEKSGCYFSADKVVKFSDFNPNDMEETKKHILCVKNGRIVRYKG